MSLSVGKSPSVHPRHRRQCVPTRPFRQVSHSERKVACTSQKADDSFAFKPRKRADWQDGPSFELTREQAVLKQLQVLASVQCFSAAPTQTRLYDRLCKATTSLHRITASKFCTALPTSIRSPEAYTLGDCTSPMALFLQQGAKLQAGTKFVSCFAVSTETWASLSGSDASSTLQNTASSLGIFSMFH